MKIDQNEWRRRLLQRRAELLALEAGSADARRPVELDQASVGRLSRMDAMQQQAMAIEAQRRRGLELRKIDAALSRLDNGEFGFCTRCGQEIDARRLELDPTIPNCVQCARS